MFTIETVRMNYYKSTEDKDIIDKATPLIKSILGYTDEEIDGFKEKNFFPPLAVNLSLGEVKLAMQPFKDAGLTSFIFVAEYDDDLEEIDFAIDDKKIGLISQPIQEHYYENPILREDQRVDPYNPPTWNPEWTTGFTFKPDPRPTPPTITCPYCKSTDCKKISGLSKVGSVALWGIFALGKTTKQFHCNSCKADF